MQLSQEQLAQWLARPIGELDLPVVMVDGIHFRDRDRVILLALGIDVQGNKHVLGLREGSTEATRGEPRLARAATKKVPATLSGGSNAMRRWLS